MNIAVNKIYIFFFIIAAVINVDVKVMATLLFLTDVIISIVIVLLFKLPCCYYHHYCGCFYSYCLAVAIIPEWVLLLI